MLDELAALLGYASRPVPMTAPLTERWMAAASALAEAIGRG